MPSFNTTVEPKASMSGDGKHLQYNMKCSADNKIIRPTNVFGERVTPSDLGSHRLSHAVLGPCCICPLRLNAIDDFTESAIFVIGKGTFAGEYVAACARNECGYFGRHLQVTYAHITC